MYNAHLYTCMCVCMCAEMSGDRLGSWVQTGKNVAVAIQSNEFWLSI